MTIATTTNKVTYTGNGATTSWSFSFPVLAAADLEVILTVIATGIESTLSVSDYTLTLSATTHTGSVLYPTSGSPLASTHKITLRRVVDYVQETDLSNGGGFYPEVVEDQFDRGVMQVQQVAEAQDRSIKIPVSDTAGLTVELPTASLRASKYIAFDASGNVIASAGPVDGVPVSTFIEGALDEATLDAFLAALGISANLRTFIAAASNAAARTALGAAASATAALQATTITAGNGLTGGGDLSASRTLAVGAGTGMVANADDIAIDKADQAAMEAETSNKVVTADIIKHSPFSPKAWVKFHTATGTPTIDGTAKNISSITDNGTGDFTLNFTTAFSSAHYFPVSSGMWDSGVAGASLNPTVYATGSLRVATLYGHSGLVDPTLPVSMVIFGDQ